MPAPAHPPDPGETEAERLPGAAVHLRRHWTHEPATLLRNFLSVPEVRARWFSSYLQLLTALLMPIRWLSRDVRQFTLVSAWVVPATALLVSIHLIRERREKARRHASPSGYELELLPQGICVRGEPPYAAFTLRWEAFAHSRLWLGAVSLATARLYRTDASEWLEVPRAAFPSRTAYLDFATLALQLHAAAVAARVAAIPAFGSLSQEPRPVGGEEHWETAFRLTPPERRLALQMRTAEDPLWRALIICVGVLVSVLALGHRGALPLAGLSVILAGVAYRLVAPYQKLRYVPSCREEVRLVVSPAGLRLACGPGEEVFLWNQVEGIFLLAPPRGGKGCGDVIAISTPKRRLLLPVWALPRPELLHQYRDQLADWWSRGCGAVPPCELAQASTAPPPGRVAYAGEPSRR